MKPTIKEIKALGWDKILISQREGFRGGIKRVIGTNGEQVAICIGVNQAFVVEDEAGLFETDDLYKGIIKGDGIDVDDAYSIEGAKVIARVITGEKDKPEGVECLETELEKYCINIATVKEVLQQMLYSVSLYSYVEPMDLVQK